jgi:hypothetical protein
MRLLKKFKDWKLKRAINSAVTILQSIDKLMVDKQYTRSERKQFWQQFIKFDSAREELFKRLKNDGADND